MTIKELIRALQKVDDQDMLVVLSRDSEGNSFDPVDRIDDNARFEPHEHEIKLRELTPALVPHGFCEEDVGDPDTHEDCLVLWP